MAKAKDPVGEKLVASNRRATFDYEIVDRYEAGMVLTGPEVKSLRAGRASLGEAFARVSDEEVWLEGMHIPRYEQMGHGEYDEVRPRKLLLHRRQIADLRTQTAEKGMTIVPMRVYFKQGIAKCEIGVGKGKKTHEKRQNIAERESKRDMDRAMSRKPSR